MDINLNIIYTILVIFVLLLPFGFLLISIFNLKKELEDLDERFNELSAYRWQQTDIQRELNQRLAYVEDRLVKYGKDREKVD